VQQFTESALRHDETNPPVHRAPVLCWAICLTLGLAACGGGTDSPAPADASADALSAARAQATLQTLEARPTFHMLPVTLDEPADTDADGQGSSARLAPQALSVPAALARLGTAGLTPEALAQTRKQALAAADPYATPKAATVYTPAQIRAAYGLPVLPGLPGLGASLSAATAATLGAGQTVYIVDAYHNPSTLADLNAFSQKFGLPTCKALTVATSATLPLAAPAADAGCTLAVVYSTANATLTTTVPAYDSGWASEIALDVQWVHATAPLARIVLIESATAMSDQLLGAVKLANAMGPGVVSMSFGAAEGSWSTVFDSAFTAAGMTYMAATGDNGAAVSWPAVSSNVLAVGGTSLSYGGSGSRSETVWSGTGGGVSAYTARPAYQAAVAAPGVGALPRRGVADVAFNADPGTGQYVAITVPGATAPGWYCYGGTSLSTPQWAGLAAVANALRVAGGKAVLGPVQPLLYTKVAATTSGAFADITSGSDGSCASCKAASGYDLPTGLGTPNFAAMLPLLAGAASDQPLVPGGALSAKVGVAFTAVLGITAPTPGTLTYTLGGAPAGLTISAQGVLGWAKPLQGSYPLLVTARTASGAAGSGTYTLLVVANRAPLISAGKSTATTGVAYTVALAGAASDPDGDSLSFSLGGGPAGMTLSTAGVLAWSKPTKGRYTPTVMVADPSGLKASATWTVEVVDPPAAPVVAAAALNGSVGSALSAQIAASDANNDPLSFSLSGAPAGMTITGAGVLNWSSPVKGSYSVLVTARDPGGLTGKATITVVIVQPNRAPVISGLQLTSSASGALSGKVSATDPDGDALSFGLSGAPAGMTLSSAGVLSWAKPVRGSYSLRVTVTDSKGLTGSATFVLTVAAAR
jgi:hypothetical protein